MRLINRIYFISWSVTRLATVFFPENYQLIFFSTQEVLIFKNPFEISLTLRPIQRSQTLQNVSFTIQIVFENLCCILVYVSCFVAIEYQTIPCSSAMAWANIDAVISYFPLDTTMFRQLKV